MKVSTIDEVMAMEADTVIQAFSGTLITLWKPKTGESDKGRWSFQNGEISAGGKKIKVCFKDRDEVPQSWKGKKITICAYHGERGWSGSYANDSDYKGKVTREIKVTKTAEITEGIAAGQPAGNDEEPPSTRRHAPAPHDTSRTAYEGDPLLAIKDAKLFISRRAAGMRIALKGGMYLAEEFKHVTGTDLPPEHVQGICTSLFISADRAGICDRLPVTLEYETLLPKPKKASAPPPEEKKPEPPKPAAPTDDPDDCPM